jgi:hypothetical protein
MPLEDLCQSVEPMPTLRRPASSSQLLRLPPELIILLADNLPMPSGACLALCRRRLARILGPRFWRSLQSEAPDVRLAFLSTLAKDLPQRFLCQDCIYLHRHSSIEWSRAISQRSHLRCVWYPSPLHLLFPSLFHIYFPHVQLAMKQHYYV